MSAPTSAVSRPRSPREPGRPVGAGHQDVGDAALAQLGEDLQPELGALGLLKPDSEHVAPAVGVDADRQTAGVVAHGLAVADLDHQRIEVDDRVERLQRPGLPRLDVLKDRVGDRADQVRGKTSVP
jgi:hypothetical protein